MIWLSTLYFNEEKLLRLRLAEELPAVDRFVVVEGVQTFSGHCKPRNFPTSLTDQVEYHLIPLKGDDSWAREKSQRNYFWEIYANLLADDDVIVVMDLDEVLRRDSYPEIERLAKEHGIVRILQRSHYYKLNLVCDEAWGWWDLPFAATKQYLAEHGGNLDAIRKQPTAEQVRVKAGHHFGYLMTPEEMVVKLNSFAHTEYAQPPFNTVEYMERVVRERKSFFDENARRWYPEPLDETYPATLRNNQAEWQEWLA